jgi:hypothetical protein
MRSTLAVTADAECRQLTVLFYDLVDSMAGFLAMA